MWDGQRQNQYLTKFGNPARETPIEGTRIGIFQVGELVQRHDWSLEDVTREFGLDREQAEATLDYYDEHPELVETLRAQHEAGCRQVEQHSRAED